MKYFYSIFRKVAFPLLIVVMVIGAYLPNATYTPRAHAQLAVLDAANLAANLHTAAASVTQLSITNVLNGLAWTAAKLTVQAITKSVVNWINSGYNGSPSFVTNLNGTLLSVANATADSFITQLATNGSIKSPFQSQIASAIRLGYNASQNGGFFVANPYTLNQVTPNDKAFLAGNFSQGGFNAWFATVMNPANNPYGSYQLALNALGSQVTIATNGRQTELNWGKGFLSFRGSCAVHAQSTNSGGAAYCPPGDGCDASANTPSTALSTNDACLSYNIQTPGSVIENQLEKTLGSSIDQLNLADSINEIIGAAVTNMVTNVIGSTGLFGLSQPSANYGGATPLQIASNPSAYTANSAAISQGFIQTIQTQQSQLSVYLTAEQTLKSAALSAQNAIQSSTCFPDGAEVISTEVQPIIDQTTAAITNGQNASQKISAIQTEVQNAQSQTGTTQQTTLQNASSDYQAFLSSAAVPSASDIATAQTQSVDSGTATPASQYTVFTGLIAAAQQCKAH